MKSKKAPQPDGNATPPAKSSPSGKRGAKETGATGAKSDAADRKKPKRDPNLGFAPSKMGRAI